MSAYRSYEVETREKKGRSQEDVRMWRWSDTVKTKSH